MSPKIPLPRGWNCRAKSAILHILALSHYTFTVLVAKAAQSRNRQVRLSGQQPATLLRSALKGRNPLNIRRFNFGTLRGAVSFPVKWTGQK